MWIPTRTPKEASGPRQTEEDAGFELPKFEAVIQQTSASDIPPPLNEASLQHVHLPTAVPSGPLHQIMTQPPLPVAPSQPIGGQPLAPTRLLSFLYAAILKQHFLRTVSMTNDELAFLELAIAHAWGPMELHHLAKV
jgi:hypothetical protein